MDEIINIIGYYDIEIIMGLSLGYLLLLAIILLINRRNKKRIRELDEKIQDTSTAALEIRLANLTEKLEQVQDDKKQLEAAIEHLNTKTSLAIQKIGFVRYDAFKDSGSELSYSIALLDENHDGFILSSLYVNGNSINYSKKVDREKSDVPLSVEEMIAMEKALNLE